MTAFRRIALSGEHTARTNPLDLWGRRVAVGIAVLVGIPTVVAGIIALLS
ncbi:hypothetical protein ACRAWB_14920 [Leifsonia poae]